MENDISCRNEYLKKDKTRIKSIIVPMEINKRFDFDANIFSLANEYPAKKTKKTIINKNENEKILKFGIANSINALHINKKTCLMI
jgi:hypothetical protein